MSYILHRGVKALTDAAVISTNAGLGYSIFSVTVDGAHILDAPTNLQSGMTLFWRIKNNAAGTSTLTYSGIFRFEDGIAPVLTASANAIDWLVGACFDGLTLECSYIQNEMSV